MNKQEQTKELARLWGLLTETWQYEEMRNPFCRIHDIDNKFMNTSQWQDWSKAAEQNLGRELTKKELITLCENNYFIETRNGGTR